ncbi:MAG: DNA translocase FtsK [Fastidiosipilaceae bacterium]|jgi:DNA segregation ATPase FtsK/SpoIIIE-like protein
MSNGKLNKRREITGVVFLAVAVLLSVSYYLPNASTGWLGSFFLTLGKGLIGPVAYVLPALFVYGSFEFLLGKSLKDSQRRLTHMVVLLALFAAFFHVFSVDYGVLRSLCLNENGTHSAFKALSVLWKAGVSPDAFQQLRTTYPGGLIGGLLASGLTAVAGHIGAIILLVAAFSAELIILFRFSLSSWLTRLFGRLKDSTGLESRRARRKSGKSEISDNPADERERLRAKYLAKRRQQGQTDYARFQSPHGQSVADAAGAVGHVGGFNSNSPYPPSVDGVGSDRHEIGAAKIAVKSTPQARFTPGEDADASSYPIYHENPAYQRNPDQGFSSEKRSGQTPANHEPSPRFSGSDEGFFQVGDENPLGAKRVNPDDLRLISEFPLWGAGQEETVPDADPTPLISPDPIFSFDAEHSDQSPPQIGEEAPARTDRANRESQGLGDSLFQVPTFLQPDRHDDFDPMEQRENEIDPVEMDDTSDPSAEVDSELSEHSSKTHSTVVYGNKPAGRSGSGDELTAIRAIRKRDNDPPVANKDHETAADRPSPGPSAAENSKRGVVDRAYIFPPTGLLAKDKNKRGTQDNRAVQDMAKKLEDTLSSFGVAAKVVNITTGPSIMRFELAPGPGVKVSKIVGLTDDIALSLAAVGLRIEAPIPGKPAIGIEIPNRETQLVPLRSLIESREFREAKSPLTVALGRDIPGLPIVCDLTKMPHLLIAGATGSGKSVCINSILISLLYRASPEDLRLLLVDPKVVELSVYNGIPHLLSPVVTDPKKAANTLNWAVVEMDRRYNEFARFKVRDLRAYNRSAAESDDPQMPHLPLILVVIDELADLMMTAPAEVEEAIARLTAKARAAGIHLIIATQRPSVDVITGLIKANIPSRIAFAVSSHIDSRTILDIGGAEKLLGKGDMLYYPQSSNKPIRGQGAMVTDQEVEKVLDFVRRENEGEYDSDVTRQISSEKVGLDGDSAAADEDELLPDAAELVLEIGHASSALLQRKLKIGYPRASRMIDQLEEKGWIGPFEGSKPRKVLLTETEWEAMRMAEQEDMAEGD